jgi:hypothetical protein
MCHGTAPTRRAEQIVSQVQALLGSQHQPPPPATVRRSAFFTVSCSGSVVSLDRPWSFEVKELFIAVRVVEQQRNNCAVNGAAIAT